jgi:hypothetical protein
MRTYIGLACAMALLAAGPALAAKQDFQLNNGTGYTIAEVYVAPSRSDDWEEDVLGRDVLGDGEATAISFVKAGSTCVYDLKVVYDDGEEAEWAKLDLCSISEVDIRYNRKSGETWAETR